MTSSPSWLRFLNWRRHFHCSFFPKIATRCEATYATFPWFWCLIQVWSLSRFYSVDFSQSRIGVEKCILNKRTIKVCISCSWRWTETSPPSAPHLMVFLYLCSFRKKRMRRGCGPLKGVLSPHKALQGFETKTRELMGGTEDNNVSSMSLSGPLISNYLRPLLDYIQQNRRQEKKRARECHW